MFPIFVSYARKTSAEAARALHRALGDQAFLDETDIDAGERFPEHILSALLGSRVVVVFPDQTYFSRPYCLWELQAALGPFRDADMSTRDAADSLSHLLVVLPQDDRPPELDRLPPGIQATNWKSAKDTAGVVELVQRRLTANSATLAQRYAAVGQLEADVRARLLALSANPRPEQLGPLSYHPPPGWPQSKGERFFGRADDLWRIDFALDTVRGGGAAACLSGAIEGIGGVGKTQLALEYALRFGRRRFPGGVFWVDAERGLEEQHHGVLQALSPASVPDFVTFKQEKREASAELHDALSRAAAVGARILFVIDNIPEDADPKLSAWCPAPDKVTVLTTSRATRSADDPTFPILVGVLPPEAAVQFLSSRVRATAPLEDWQAVAEWVGRLPLALTLLNAALCRKATTIEELASRARAPASQTAALDDLRKVLGPGTSGVALRGITDAFELSYSLLTPDAQMGARLLARLAPTAVPEVLVAQLEFPDAVRSLLTERSFISDDIPATEETSVASFGAMHRVLADYIRTRSDNPVQEWDALRWALSTVLYRRHAVHLQWRVMQACMTHARHVLRNRPTTLTDEADDTVADLALIFGTCLCQFMQFEEAVISISEAVVIHRKLAKEHAETFAPRLAMSLNNLSSCLSDLRRLEEAHAAAQEAVEIYRNLAKEHPEAFEPGLALSLITLSHRLSDLGRREDAHAVVRESVESCRELSKVQPDVFEPDLAKSLNALAARLSELGRTEEALAALREAVAIHHRLAKVRPDTFESPLAETLNNLAGCLRDLGRTDEAVTTLREVVEVFRKLAKMWPQGYEPTLAMTLNNIAMCLGQMGRTEEALITLREAVEIYRKHAKTHPDTFEPTLAGTMNNLSGCLGELGRTEEARAVAQEAMEIYRKRLADREAG